MITVSIHIVTYNSKKYLRDCLRAIFAQSYPIKQIIIVDNASEDGTITLVESFKSSVDCIFNQTNVGFAKGHNQAISESKADFFLVLNPDVTLHPDYVLNLVKYAEIHPDIGSLTGKLVLASNEQVIDSCGLKINRARRAFELGSGEESDKYVDVLEVFGVSGAAALYRRQMVEDISFHGEFFDESFFAYKEDVDVAWRAQLFNWRAVCVPDAQAIHERGWGSGGRKKQNLFIRKCSYINRYKMILKNDRIKNIIKDFFPFVIFEILSLGYMILREPRVLGAWKQMRIDYRKMKQWRKHILERSKGQSSDVYHFFGE